MQYQLTDEALTYLKNAEEETVALIEALCRIPAPSHFEDERAEFCKAWLENIGAEGVVIDEAKNVLFPVGCEGKDDIVLFLAHTDTVFPNRAPMPVKKDNDYIYAPGVGDDTTCLAMLLMIAKYAVTHRLSPSCGILFAANSCEEGLGNLKGIRQIMKTYAGRIKKVYAFDAQYTSIVHRTVGSHRYEITVKTEGGHSFGDFGNQNAIHAASQLICRLYEAQLPKKENTKTTYNVGEIRGGTSVNTIAEEASFLYEYRSDDAECLAAMQENFNKEIENTRQTGASVSVTMVGERPCGGDVDQEVLSLMVNRVADIYKRYTGMPFWCACGSTDCNIPMALGIPAIAVGTYLGDGAHTMEEKVLLKSIPVGLKIVAELILGYFE